jgi:O-antigen/teichoic acid export membrane protein
MSVSKNARFLILSRIAVMVFTVIGTPLITRIYTPIEYEIWLTWYSGILIIVSIGTLCYENAIILPKNHKQAMVICQVCVLISAFISTFGPILYFLSVKIGLTPTLEINIYFFAIVTYLTAFFTSITNSFIAYLTRFEQYLSYAITQSAFPVFTILFQSIIGYYQPKFQSLFISTILAQSVALLLASVFLFKNGKYILTSRLVRLDSIKLLLEYSNYPKFTTPYNLLGVLRERFIYFVIARQGNGLTALYGLSFRLMNLPNTLIASSLRPLMFQQLKKHGFKKFQKNILFAQETLTSMFPALWAFLLVYAEQIFNFIFDDKWNGAGIIASIISISTVPHMLSNYLDRVFDITGKQQYAFIIELVTSLCILVGIFTCIKLGHNGIYIIITHSLILSSFYIVYHLCIFHFAKFSLVIVIKNYLQLFIGTFFLYFLHFVLKHNCDITHAFIISAILTLGITLYQLYKIYTNKISD